MILDVWFSVKWLLIQSEFWSSQRQTDIQKVMHKSPPCIHIGWLKIMLPESRFETIVVVFLVKSCKFWYFCGTITHGGIPYAVAHCRACFYLQGNGFCLQDMEFGPYVYKIMKQISVALQIKTSLTMGKGIGYPTQWLDPEICLSWGKGE